MSILVEEFIKEAKRRQEDSSTPTLRKALLYGAGGAVGVPATKTLQSLIEHKGKLPPSPAHYQVGRLKIPSRLAALATSGFVGAGLLPYLQEAVRSRRHKIQKNSAAISAIRAKPVSALSMKQPTKLLHSAQRAAFMPAGDYRL